MKASPRRSGQSGDRVSRSARVQDESPAHAKPKASPSRQPGILVLAKVKDVIDLFTTQVERAGPSEVAARLGGNKSSTFRLLTSMERVGLLDRQPDGSYALGLRLMELGAIVGARLDVRRAAEPYLADLRSRLNQTVFLSVRHASTATCIDRFAGTNVDVLALRLGGTLPLHCGAGPRVLLAHMPRSELDELLADAPFPQLTRNTLTTAAQLEHDILSTRSRGYVLSLEDVTLGVAAVGAPVFDSSGSVVAAVSVAGLRHDYEGDQADRIADVVVSVANEVTNAIGGRAPGPAVRSKGTSQRTQESSGSGLRPL